MQFAAAYEKLEIADLLSLKEAKQLLENPGFTAKVTNYLGAPIEKGLDSLPDSVREKIISTTETALKHATSAALWTMKNTPHEAPSNLFHKVAVAVSGGVGGFFGVAALAAELPVSTTLMLRSIADIARSEGECLDNPDCKIACVEVFALGSERKENDDGVNSAYFAARAALAKSVTEAAEYLVEKSIVDAGAPALVRLIAAVASRFGVQVGEKVVAQAVPIIGAVGGATINTLFMNHFQDMARGHFIVRRLERKYGKELIKVAYDSCDNA